MTQNAFPNKRVLIAIFVGLIIILLRGWILSALSLSVASIVIQYSPASQIYRNLAISSKIINLQVISSIITIFAGGIVGYISRKFGWLYGLITGLIASTISLGFYPLLLVETLIGGWLGEKLANLRKKKLST